MRLFLITGQYIHTASFSAQ